MNNLGKENETMSRILGLQRLTISQDHSMGFVHSGISVHCTDMHPSDQSDWCCNPTEMV